MCMYMYMYECVYICMYMYVYVYMYMGMYVYIYIYMTLQCKIFNYQILSIAEAMCNYVNKCNINVILRQINIKCVIN